LISGKTPCGFPSGSSHRIEAIFEFRTLFFHGRRAASLGVRNWRIPTAPLSLAALFLTREEEK
jgi:hypothetical protein